MAYEIRTEQKFTDVGLVGAALFIGGPTGSAICYAWYLSQLGLPSYESSASGAPLLMALCGIAFLVGCVLMFIGREQTHTVRKSEEQSSVGQQLRS